MIQKERGSPQTEGGKPPLTGHLKGELRSVQNTDRTSALALWIGALALSRGLLKGQFV
ncbi:MAG: hypothetical protein WBB29_13815 [Geitlerinemataceae cyanobacterium]